MGVRTAFRIGGKLQILTSTITLKWQPRRTEIAKVDTVEQKETRSESIIQFVRLSIW